MSQRFDPSTWRLQVGRRWKHPAFPALFIETEQTHQDPKNGELRGLRTSNGVDYFFAARDLESIDEAQGEDQPTFTVDTVSSLTDFQQKQFDYMFDYMKERELETFELIVKSETQALTQQEFSKISSFDREWLTYNTLQSLIQKINTMNPQLTALLADEDQELAQIGTIASGVNTLVANATANSTLIAQLQAQIAAGNTEPADLTTIANKLAANDAAMTPILTALAASLPTGTFPATPAATPAA